MLVGLPFPDASVVKKWPYNAGDTGSIPWLGRSLKKETSTYFSVLAWKTPWTEGAWPTTIHGVPKELDKT